MVYGKVEMENKPNEWVECGSHPLACGKICHSSVLCGARLRFLKYDINSWKFFEPDDYDMWRRMKEVGVRMGFINKIAGKYYLESKDKSILD